MYHYQIETKGENKISTIADFILPVKNSQVAIEIAKVNHMKVLGCRGVMISYRVVELPKVFIKINPNFN